MYPPPFEIEMYLHSGDGDGMPGLDGLLAVSQSGLEGTPAVPLFI